MEDFLKEAKRSSRIVSQLDSKTKVNVLNQMAQALINNTELIVAQNRKDIADANANDLSDALKDRLLLDSKRIEDMANAIRQIASHKEPLGKILDGWITEDGLKNRKSVCTYWCNWYHL